MSDKLRFLVRLADDESSSIRDKIADQLRDLHHELDGGVWPEIERQGLQLTSTQSQAIQDALEIALPDATALIELAPVSPERAERADQAFRRAWRHWLHSHHQSRISEMQRLEEAFDLLARWQLGKAYTVRLANLLDRLAMEYMERDQVPDYQDLADFLFIEKGLTGAIAEDYYSPANSNLVQVIESGHGLPISLTCIFMMVAERLDLTVHGCNFPNHFLARVHEDNRELVFDCFNGGRILTDAEVAALRKAAPEAMSTPASSIDIITRVLNNLSSAYHYLGESNRTEFVVSLLNDLRQTDPHYLQD